MFDINKDIYTKCALIWFGIMSIWWITLYALDHKIGTDVLLFGAVYGTVITFCTAIIGVMTAKEWGGIKSIMGKAILFLSAGVFAQFFGQCIFSVYNIILGVETPYPSIADIGYFGNIPLYVMGIIYLAKASGVSLSLSSFKSKIQAILIPSGMIAISYFLFLKDYDFSSSPWITTILDFGYPMGQGLYLAIAIVTYSLSVKTLGGIMRNKILVILAAFILQYIADVNFLYQHLQGTWYNGGYGDYLYLVAYVVMAIGLFQLRVIAKKLRASSTNE